MMRRFQDARNPRPKKVTPDFNVRVQWGPRQDSLSNCVERTLEQLKVLKEMRSSYGDWLEVMTDGPLTQDEERPRDLDDKAVVEGVLLHNRQKNDLEPPEIMHDLGYRGWFTNTRKDIDLQVKCGAYADITNAFRNDCAFSFALKSPDALSQTEAVELLRQMLMIWDASFGVIYDGDFYRLKSSKTLVRYASPQEQYHPGFPPVGKIIGQWRSGRLWAVEELESAFKGWNLDPPRPLSIVEKAKFLFNF
jgi:hypothetical protein